MTMRDEPQKKCPDCCGPKDTDATHMFCSQCEERWWADVKGEADLESEGKDVYGSLG